VSEHRASVSWKRTTESFAYEDYNREHEWTFEGGRSFAASAAPEFRGRPGNVDPEAAFVASVSSCHMLSFLAICARKRLVVDRYDDDAVGFLEPDDEGRLWIRRVVLRPRVRFAGDRAPDGARLSRIHEMSHEQCFIANSVRTEITVEAE
jgi:organic hydroperoxide reductase OsmC/OhrA